MCSSRASRCVRAVPIPDKAVEIRWEDTLVQHSRFTVVETFKGHPDRIAELRSGFGHGDCGVALVAGMDYLLLVGDDGIVSYCSGFFGPHYGWNDKSLFRSERREQLDHFTESVRAHYASRAKIARAPSGELGIEDDATRWFQDQVADPSSDCAKHH